ncbi:MAG: ATP-binding cassette domain-containing protein [Lentisphaeraceae bacterium]|nr:ATP-binding cassette domain-containing protein [Lentisphaeraceae bacterium]
MAELMIEAKELCKYYGSFKAVENMSFSIPKGQVVAFLGPNGAGKSTTMKLLTGFISASNGEAHIAGYDMAADRLKAAEVLGYLPENGPLYPDMTPRESLTFTGEIRGLKGERLASAIDRVVKICDLKEVYDKAIGKLSKGYRQRVGMAQALIHDPEVLIMDEPTSGLDPNQIRTVRDTIKELGKNKTILLSTHILQEVEAMCDRVLFISEGRLIFDGTVEEFKKKNENLDDVFYALTHDKEVVS